MAAPSDAEAVSRNQKPATRHQKEINTGLPQMLSAGGESIFSLHAHRALLGASYSGGANADSHEMRAALGYST
jgi:hypothetical protein